VKAPKVRTTLSEEAAWIDVVYGDARAGGCSFHRRPQRIAVRVESENGEGPAVGVAVATQLHVKDDGVDAVHRASRGIKADAAMVEPVMALTYLLPHPETDIPNERRAPSGIDDLGAVAVPLLSTSIYYVHSDRHFHVPETHDAGFAIAIFIGH